MKWFKTKNNVQKKMCLNENDTYEKFEAKDQISKDLYKEILKTYGNHFIDELFEGKMVDLPFLGKMIITKLRP